MSTGESGEMADIEPEHVVRIIERPSQMRMTTPAAVYQQTRTDAQSLQPLSAGVTSVPAPGRADVNQQLVDRIEELYRQIHNIPDNAPPPAV